MVFLALKRKIIEIRDEDGYRAFLEKLPLYRSAIFSHTVFEIRSEVHGSRIRDIEAALNIKGRRARVVFLHDRASDIIDEYNEAQGIYCKYEDGKCEDPKHQRFKNGCCCHCYLQSSTGCHTKNLACKLFFCDFKAAQHEFLGMEKIDLLRLFTRSQRLIARENIYASRGENIALLTIGSYLIFCIYSLFKLFRMKNI